MSRHKYSWCVLIDMWNVFAKLKLQTLDFVYACDNLRDKNTCSYGE